MKSTYIYSVSSLLQIDTPYLCHIDLKISSLTAVTNCRLELQPVVTNIPKCGNRTLASLDVTWRHVLRTLKVGSCPNDDNSVHFFLFALFCVVVEYFSFLNLL